MFGKKRKVVPEYDDITIEHVLGYILVYRGDIIPNRVFTEKERDINGMIGFDGCRLIDDLDYVALQYAYKYFISRSIAADRLDRVLSSLFDRFVLDEIVMKNERDSQYNFAVERVHSYLGIKSTSSIGMLFMRRVVEGHDALGDDTGRYVAPVLKSLERNIYRRIDAELAV